MRGLGPALLLSLLLVTATVPLTVGEAGRDPMAACDHTATGVSITEVDLTYPDETVRGCLATPSDPAGVDTLVVFAHGLGWTVQAGWLDHMAEVVQRAPDTAAVATNYRDNFGFPVLQGAQDTVRATQEALDQLPGVDHVVLFGVSMGGAVSGTAIHIAPAMNDGEPLYDRWYDVEGVTNLFETYTEARVVGLGVPFAAEVADGIERDAGGTPTEVPEAYALRSPVFNAEAMAATGLEDVVIVHAVNDGLVPYDQSREMQAALVGAGVPVVMHTVLFTEPDQTAGTTPTSHALPSDQDPNEQHLHLAGHASEADRGHPVMHAALEDLIHGLNNGADPAVHEVVHPGDPS